MPIAPRRVSDSYPANVEIFDLDTDTEPILISKSLGVRTLTVEGIIHAAGQTKENLETNYISPLAAKRGKEVTLAFPNSRYDGTWLLAAFDYQEVAEGKTAKFAYTLKFMQGSDHVVL